MLSSGHGSANPSLAARSMEKATPTARGRWEAIVEVCGMMCRSCRPNLVPAATDRLLGRRDDPEQHVPQPVAVLDLLRAGQEEATRAVVQQRGIGRAESGGDGDVSLVSRRADGVEPLPAGTEPA